MSFQAGGIGDNSLTRTKLTDLCASTVGVLSTGDLSYKSVVWDFNRNAIDTAVWGSTVSGGTNVFNGTGTFGVVTTSTTATNGRNAKMLSTTFLKIGTKTVVVEFNLTPQIRVPGGNCKFKVGLSPAMTNANENNSIVVDYGISNAATLNFTTIDNAGTVQRDTITNFSSTTGTYTIRFYITASEIKCYIGGVQVGTTHTTIPSTSTSIYVGWYIENGADALEYALLMKSIRAVVSW